MGDTASKSHYKKVGSKNTKPKKNAFVWLKWIIFLLCLIFVVVLYDIISKELKFSIIEIFRPSQSLDEEKPLTVDNDTFKEFKESIEKLDALKNYNALEKENNDLKERNEECIRDKSNDFVLLNGNVRHTLLKYAADNSIHLAFYDKEENVRAGVCLPSEKNTIILFFLTKDHKTSAQYYISDEGLVSINSKDLDNKNLGKLDIFSDFETEIDTYYEKNHKNPGIKDVSVSNFSDKIKAVTILDNNYEPPIHLADGKGNERIKATFRFVNKKPFIKLELYSSNKDDKLKIATIELVPGNITGYECILDFHNSKSTSIVDMTIKFDRDGKSITLFQPGNKNTRNLEINQKDPQAIKADGVIFKNPDGLCSSNKLTFCNFVYNNKENALNSQNCLLFYSEKKNNASEDKYYSVYLGPENEIVIQAFNIKQ